MEGHLKHEEHKFRTLWDTTVQRFGLGQRLLLLITDLDPGWFTDKFRKVDNFMDVKIPDGSAYYVLHNACHSIGTLTYEAIRRGRQVEVLTDCSPRDPETLHNMLVRALQAFRGHQTRPNVSVALLDGQSFEVQLQMNVNDVVQSTNYPARSDTTRPKWAPEYDASALRKLISKRRAGVSGTASPTPTKSPSNKLSTTEKGLIIGGSVAGAVAIAVLIVILYEVNRRR